MVNVPNGVETLPKVSMACVGRTNVTDRQADVRRHNSEREREFTFAKNYSIFLSFCTKCCIKVCWWSRWQHDDSDNFDGCKWNEQCESLCASH